VDRLGPATPVSQAAGSWLSAGGGAAGPAERRRPHHRVEEVCFRRLHPRHGCGGKEAWPDRLGPAIPVSQVAGAWRESGSRAAVPQVLQSAGGPTTELKTGMKSAVRLTRTAAERG